VYLFVFSNDPISIELVVPKGVVLIVHPVIALTIQAVHPMRAVLALRGGGDRWLAGGVILAASCKLTVGVLVMGFAALGACGCLFGVVFVGMFPLPALPAKWSPY
jgi:hypothetical protein